MLENRNELAWFSYHKSYPPFSNNNITNNNYILISYNIQYLSYVSLYNHINVTNQEILRNSIIFHNFPLFFDVN